MTLQQQALDRLFSVETFVKTSCVRGAQRLSAFAKGSAFVHLYAVYEFSLRGSVTSAIQAIKIHGLKAEDLKPSIAALVLDPAFCSVIDCTDRSARWDRRTKLLETLYATSPVDAPDSTFPVDGSHFRKPQLQRVWKIFDLPGLIVPQGRLMPLIDELVENRNAIAHGRRSAEDVGKSYSKADILKKIKDTQDVCIHIIQTIDNHCSQTPNLKR